MELRKKLILTGMVLAAMLAGCGGIYYFYFAVAPLPKLSWSSTDDLKIKKHPQYIEGEFFWRINKPLNQKTLVRYMIPLDPLSGKPGKNAGNIVFYAPYNGDARRIRGGLLAWHRSFAEQMGYTIFSLTIEANVQILGDVEKYYIYKESGWYDLVFKIKEHLEEEYSLESRRLLIVGESSGGSMAQQMAVALPEKIAAAAWNGGSRYVSFGKHSSVALLALNTWGCYGIPSTKKMVEDARKYGINILQAESYPAMKKSGEYEHHAANEFTYNLIRQYIRGIVELQNNNHGVSQDGGFIPSNACANIWNKLPRQAISLLNRKSNELIIFPPPEIPKSVVLMICSPEDILIIKDTMLNLTQKQMVAMAVLTESDAQSDVRRVGMALAAIGEMPEYGNLPLIVIGRNFEGQLAISAILKYPDKRIKKIIAIEPVFSLYQNNPFDMTLLESPSVPVEIFYHEEIHGLPLNATNLTVRKIPPVKTNKDWFDLLRKIMEIH